MIALGWETTMVFATLVALAYVAAVWIGLAIWTSRDVKRRTANEQEQLAAVMVVVLFSVPGWLVYLIMRPQTTLEDAHIERLQQDLFARELAAQPSCARCRRGVSEEFLVCPYCRETLRVPCAACERPLALAWEACAYCGTARVPAQAAPPAVRAVPATRAHAPVPARVRSAMAR